MILVIFWIIASLILGWTWYEKGHSPIAGFLISLLLSPIIGIIITLLVKKNIEVVEKRKSFEYNYNRSLPNKKKHGEVSPEVKQLLKNLYDECCKKSLDLSKLKLVLHNLFEFLISEKGRTSANCHLVSAFVIDGGDRWRTDLAYLPEAYKRVFYAIEGLHGIVEQPGYHTSPEEILKMIDNLPEECDED